MPIPRDVPTDHVMTIALGRSCDNLDMAAIREPQWLAFVLQHVVPQTPTLPELRLLATGKGTRTDTEVKDPVEASAL